MNSPDLARAPAHDRRRRLLALLDELRAGDASHPMVGEALSLLKLILTHPRPGPEFGALKSALRQVIPARRVDPSRHAALLRDAALRLESEMPALAHGKLLARLLCEYAVRLDDMPWERLRLVEMHLSAAGVALPSPSVAVPEFEESKGNGPFKHDELLFSVLSRHVRSICQSALSQLAAAKPFGGWSMSDFEAALIALRMNYCVNGCSVSGMRLPSVDLRVDFQRFGLPLWNAMLEAMPRESKNSKNYLADSKWHAMAQAQVLLAIGSERPRKDPAEPTPQPVNIAGPSLVVCASPIARSSDRVDKDEIERHLVLERPLPLARMPSRVQLESMQRRLQDAFPWACDVLDVIFADLHGRSALGVSTLLLPATLLVGPPGSGKSRLAGRIADVLGMPRLDLPLGGTSDTKVLGGTSRGWASARPSDVATLLAQRRSASAILILDELDKAADQARPEGGGLQSYLLSLLEPETARRHTDVFLKTACDFTGVSWLATANRTSCLSPPLLSRLRVLMVGQPKREHYPAIAEGVLRDLAGAWGLSRWALPTLSELDPPLDQLSSARQVRVAVEVEVSAWARRQAKH